MKQEERIAEQYLMGLGLGQVVFEPDGNIPPDFYIGKTIGVEVRRLNQQYFGSSDPEGLEQLSFPLWDLIKKELSKFDSKYNGNSYCIGVEYHRPYNKSAKDTAKSVREELKNFLLRGDQAPLDLIMNNNLKLTLFPASPTPGRTFMMGSGLDHDSGGALLSMYIDNINHCVDQKTIKVNPYLNRYKEWWLLLVDSMGWRLDNKDSSFVKSNINSLGNFNRMQIISYGNGRLLFDM